LILKNQKREEGALMNKTISYGSLEELDALDAREKRHSVVQTSYTSIIQRPGLKDALIESMEKYDPGGNMAHELTADSHCK
jgi:hypothetical protein